MSTRIDVSRRGALGWLVTGCACALLLSPALVLAASQRTFDTPRQAADALIAAAADYDVPALKQILGPGADDIIDTKDTVQDKNIGAAFAARARQKSDIVIDPKNKDRATLVIGDEDWPAPMPIVRTGGKWAFDAKAGRTEILHRRIGANELDAIEICRGYVEAQREYALTKHDGDRVNQYAQRIISTPGMQDGLAWKKPDGTWGGPVGEAIAQIIGEGYGDPTKPYHGYYFKILKGQGPSAPLGQMDFVVGGVGGAMIGGFALVAAPAEYRVTGVKTFIVSHDGIVYEQDLGPKTLEKFKEMERYDPGKGWTPVRDP